MPETINKKELDQLEKEEMVSMAPIMNMLLKEGYKTQFEAVEKGLKSLTTEKIFQPEEVKIVNFYRFEGESDPSDNAILYAIETNNGEKGTLTDSYGAYGDANVATFIQQVKSIHKNIESINQ